MAVALDGETVGHCHRAGGGDPSDVVATEVEQHHMFGAFLLVGEEIGGQRLVLGLGLAAPTGARDGPDRHLAVTHAHQDFRARTNDLERPKSR